MTKEELFNSESDVLSDLCGDPVCCLVREDAYKVMDEYAKQQAIAFDEWKVLKGIKCSLNMFGEVSYEQNGVCLDTQSVYNQFIEQQNKDGK